MNPRGKWLLLADIHFKHQDLDRITRTASWITALAAQHRVRRAIVCGDLLTTRSYQPTRVLSACYRFLDSLIHDAAVPHVNVVLGNHDLAYRGDHRTTALDALRLAAPAVQLHTDVEKHVWDGRPVLTLPFRQDQRELTDAVAGLDPRESAETVAFAHLAIHKAVTQRHVVRPGDSAKDAVARTRPITYHGFTGPGHFSQLARTFTGHFHSHQTMRPLQQAGGDDLAGSLTYVGSPLQLTWADLCDENRGVVLLDPETLEHELFVNPHAVGYVTVNVGEVLDGPTPPTDVQGKHVMLLGDLTRYKYVAARDRLVQMGVRSVRHWSPTMPKLVGEYSPAWNVASARILGASVPASDQPAQMGADTDFDEQVAEGQTAPANGHDTEAPRTQIKPLAQPERQQLNLPEQVRRYVDLLDLDESLDGRRNDLVKLGQRLMNKASSGAVGEQSLEGEVDASSEIAQGPDSGVVHVAKSESDARVFDARPRSIAITNFLGIQSTLHINFATDISRGLTYLIGENGAGKSTLIEAIVWCQFGKCVRSGLAADDVVNDKAKRDCSVRLEFENGYAITRYRKHKVHGKSRVVVEHDGEHQSEFDKADARGQQAAIDELLGIDYDTFIRTVVLGHESAASFLSSSLTQRRDLIETALGLEILDVCAHASRQTLRKIETDITALESKTDGVNQTIDHIRDRIAQLQDTERRVRGHLEEASRDTRGFGTEHVDAGVEAAAQVMPLEEQIAEICHEVESLMASSKDAGLRRAYEQTKHEMEAGLLAARERLVQQRNAHSKLLRTRPPKRRVPAVGQFTATVVNGLSAACRRLEEPIPSTANSSLLQRFGKFPIRLVWVVMTTLLSQIRKWRGLDAIEIEQKEAQREQAGYSYRLNAACEEIANSEQALALLEGQFSDASLLQHVAVQHETTIQQVRNALSKVSADDVPLISAHLHAALVKQSNLQKQREAQATVQQLQEKAATYKQIIDKDVASLQRLQAQSVSLQKQFARLAADRDLSAFWVSALAKRSRRTSSSTGRDSPSGSDSSSSYTFREFVLEKKLGELNELMAQILTILYEDSRHARAMTTGMLKSLFHGEGDGASGDAGGGGDSRQARPLDKSLGVDGRLAYGKRSGGERKRIDLALFFALLHMSHAWSPHRAQYVLVDEVFDTLDAAGQSAVVRWCDAMTAGQVRFVLVVTHSGHLASLAEGGAAAAEDHDGSFGRHDVIVARMGDEGVEFEKDGRRLGVSMEDSASP